MSNTATQYTRESAQCQGCEMENADTALYLITRFSPTASEPAKSVARYCEDCAQIAAHMLHEDPSQISVEAIEDVLARDVKMLRDDNNETMRDHVANAVQMQMCVVGTIVDNITDNTLRDALLDAARNVSKRLTNALRLYDAAIAK